MSVLTRPAKTIEYPDSDGLPMAENTLQFEWIVTIEGGLEAMYADNPQVFVAGDCFWYPVEGEPGIRQAPDAFVVFGRPKGHRSSYMQWVEGGIAPQVVWEILSPDNRPSEMARKFVFYEKYGVEEYYIYDPDKITIAGWIRTGDQLEEIPSMQGWVSPRLGIRFELTDETLRLYRPDGQPFITFVELSQRADQALKDWKRAERAKQEAERAKQEAERAKQEAESGKQQAEREKDMILGEAERLRAQLKALGIEPQA